MTSVPLLCGFLLALSRAAAQGSLDEPWYDPAGPHTTTHKVVGNSKSLEGADRSAEDGGRTETVRPPRQRRSHRDLAAPLPTPDDPVLAGYDLVAYHSLDPLQDGVPGSSEFSHRHTNGFLYYFSTDANRAEFVRRPEKYLPKYGGFCAWGIAWEYADRGWPWAADHMGPPCGPSDGWAIIDGALYCSIWRSYQDDFNANSAEGIRLADARWIKFYGSLSGGPQNNGCYAWNWQECHRRSIHTAVNWQQVQQLTPPPTPSPVVSTPAPTEVLFPADDEVQQVVTTWSETRSAMEDNVAWKWTLADLETPTPLLIVEMSSAAVASDEYVAFGVAEQLMQGALVACSENMPSAAATSVSRASPPSSSRCLTLLGEGMGVTVPEIDPVNPRVLFSSRNETHYTVRFSASLFGCWAHPRLPARVLFARGKVSGDGAPRPHLNDGANREAVTGIGFLSVVQGYDDSEPDGTFVPPPPKPELVPLPAWQLWEAVEGSRSGIMFILDGRVTVGYKLFQHDGAEIVTIGLHNVAFASEETYVAFGFAEHVMSGLVMSCAPRLGGGGSTGSTVSAKCHQWRGEGTNLLPLDARTDAGGWVLRDVASNGTHFNYTFAGWARDVIMDDALHEGSILPSDEGSSSSVRAICAVGRSSPDTGTPWIHQVGDRVGFQLTFGPTHQSLASSAPMSSRDGEKALLLALCFSLFSMLI